MADVRRHAASARSRARPCTSSIYAPEKIAYAHQPLPVRGASATTASSTSGSPSSKYMVGDTYTIVDMDVWGWARMVPFILGEDAWAKLPNLKRLVDEISARPAAAKRVALKDKSSSRPRWTTRRARHVPAQLPGAGWPPEVERRLRLSLRWRQGLRRAGERPGSPAFYSARGKCLAATRGANPAGVIGNIGCRLITSFACRWWRRVMRKALLALIIAGISPAAVAAAASPAAAGAALCRAQSRRYSKRRGENRLLQALPSPVPIAQAGGLWLLRSTRFYQRAPIYYAPPVVSIPRQSWCTTRLQSSTALIRRRSRVTATGARRPPTQFTLFGLVKYL